jgi:hypothetical protein
MLALYETRFRENYPDTSPLYAEPGMNGTIYLDDDFWVLKDDADVEYRIAFPQSQESLTMYEARFRENYPDVYHVYAETGMTGTIYLVDGHWVLRDSSNVDYFIVFPQEWNSLRMFEARYRESTVEASAVYEEQKLISILTGESLSLDNVEAVDYPVTQSYFLDYIWEFNVDLPENEAMARKIYDTIVRIESAPDRPPEIIMDLGVVREENNAGKFSAPLYLIKQLSNGKYYLQIGIFDRKEILARKLTSLNWAYPYALEINSDLRSPKYKLLVGPLNEGESNALLLRFKRYGYPDAFIRRDS